MRGFATFSCVVLLASCAKELRCGPGTVEKNEECVSASPVDSKCDPAAGDHIIQGVCVPKNVGPALCGPNTIYDPTTGYCKGTGGGQALGCHSTCSDPGASTVCLTGTAFLFTDPTTRMMPTAQSHAKARVFDPIAFVTNPGGTPPLATVDVEDSGCYIADGVPRPSSGLIAVSVDDDDPAGATWVTMGTGAILQPSKNVTGLAIYGLLTTDVERWQGQIGASNPPGCADGLLGCGVWIGAFLDASGNPVGDVQPTRPGDDPPASNVFCFGADRSTLTTNTTTHPATGLCIISPDTVEPHGGACASGGCTCAGGPCAMSWTSSIGGSAPGVVFYQPFLATN